MTKLQFNLISLMAITGLLASLLIQHRAHAKLSAKDKALQEQDDRLTESTTEGQRLSNLVARIEGTPTNDQLSELQQLRSEAGELWKRIENLEKRLAMNPPQRPPHLAWKEEPHPPEYWQLLNQTAGGKTKDAFVLSTAITRYVGEHQGQFPSNFDQVSSYLRKLPPLTGTNDFEIVYQGSLAALKGIPYSSVAVIRDRQTWLAPSGKWARVYGISGGIGQIIESDDNFQSWEAEHIFASPTD
jgi:hypothetical protein